RLGDATKGADEVDLDDPVEGIEREMLDAAIFLGAARSLDRVAGASAIDEDAFLPDRGARLFKRGIDRGVVGDVAFAEHTAELFGNRLALFFLQVEDRDLHALRRERAGSSRAEARSASGNDGRNGGVEF